MVVLSLPLQVGDNDQPRQVISITQSIYPEGTGDRASQSELLKGKHETFQEAIGRAIRSYQVAGNTGRKGCQLAFLARHIS